MIEPYIQKVNLLNWESIDDHTGLREIIIEAYGLVDFYDDHYFDLTIFDVKYRKVEDTEKRRILKCLEENEINNYDDLLLFLTDLCYQGYLEPNLYIIDFEGSL